VELTGGSEFPPVGDLPYILTLPAYGFYWFQLTTAPAARPQPVPTAPELFTLVLTGGPETLFKGRERTAFERTTMPSFLASRRWFAGKGRSITATSLIDLAMMRSRSGRDDILLPLIAVELRGGERHDYFIPLALEEGREEEELLPYAVARVRRGPRVGLLYGAASSPSFAIAFLDALRRGDAVPTTEGGTLRFAPTAALADYPDVDPSEVKRLTTEQSNTSIAVGEQMILKIYRRLQSGTHPEIEVGRFLTEVAQFRNTPELLGSVEHVAADGTTTALVVLQRFVRNQGDAWSWSIETLKRELDTATLVSEQDAASLEEVLVDYLPTVRTLGRRTAELHLAFATPSDDPAFAVEDLTASDVEVAAADARDQGSRAFAAIERLVREAPETAPAPLRALAARRDECWALIDRLAVAPVGAVKTRIHGDYHLGQVLIVQNDVMIVDFEGEPARPADERRAKSSPLRDVAGMLRSFAYAAETAARNVEQRVVAEAAPRLAELALASRQVIERTFLEAYAEVAGGSRVWVEDPTTRRNLLQLHLLGKALYEINYEANHRPEWIETPVRGVLSILDQAGGEA
jgi:maltose alpha-D-glucosyltransferase/alpha-amylase